MTQPCIFITGSARGIGAATARVARQKGWLPLLHGHTESPHLKALASELETSYYVADVADATAIQQAIQRAHHDHKRLDALVNCAGIVKPKPFLDMSPEDWNEEYRVNVLGTVFACQAALALMQTQEQGGRIVNISSIRGMYPTTSERGTAYSMSKAAVISLTEALAKAYSPTIRVNAVAPGFTATDMAQTWNDKVWTQAKSALLNRPAKPEEIAAAIMFLAGDDSAFITGQTLVVDGGYGLAGK